MPTTPMARWAISGTGLLMLTTTAVSGARAPHQPPLRAPPTRPRPVPRASRPHLMAPAAARSRGRGMTSCARRRATATTATASASSRTCSTRRAPHTPSWTLTSLPRRVARPSPRRPARPISLWPTRRVFCALVHTQDFFFAKFVVCKDIRAAMHRAFQTWTDMHQHINFIDVTEECRRLYGKVQSNCSLVEVFVTDKKPH